MARQDETQLVDDLLRVSVQAAQAVEMVQKHAPRAATKGRREAFNSVLRHAKGMQMAAALLRQQVEHGT